MFVSNGLDVNIFDARKEASEKAVEGIKKTAQFIKKNHLVKSPRMGRVNVAPSLAEAVTERDYVQESVFESYETKDDVFRLVSRINPDTIIASSTSSLSISRMQASATDPSLCLSVHPLNPVYLVPAVEVVGGEKTSRATLSKVCDFMSKLGKVPIRLEKEVPGHLADRLQAALWREALDMLDRGVASARDIDNLMTMGLGPRWAVMGPFLRAHVAGGPSGLEYYLNHIEPSHAFIWKDMSNWKSAPESAKKKALASLDSLTEGADYAELVQWRDDLLVQLLLDKKKGVLRHES